MHSGAPFHRCSVYFSPWQCPPSAPRGYCGCHTPSRLQSFYPRAHSSAPAGGRSARGQHPLAIHVRASVVAVSTDCGPLVWPLERLLSCSCMPHRRDGTELFGPHAGLQQDLQIRPAGRMDEWSGRYAGAEHEWHVSVWSSCAVCSLQ